jgi:hypothetical protein
MVLDEHSISCCLKILLPRPLIQQLLQSIAILKLEVSFSSLRINKNYKLPNVSRLAGDTADKYWLVNLRIRVGLPKKANINL